MNTPNPSALPGHSEKILPSATGPSFPLSPRFGKLLPVAIAALLPFGLVRGEQPEFEFFSYTGKDIFPSAVISTATVNWSDFGAEPEAEEEEAAAAEEEEAEADEELEEIPLLGDENGWLGVSLSNVPAGADLKVELVGEGWLKPSRFSGKAVSPEGVDLEGDIDVMPKGAWDYEALRLVQEQKPVNLTIKVSVNGKELPEQTETLVLRSINDCPFFVVHDAGTDDESVDDLSWCFAAYVNENHPWIDALLKEALTTAKDSDGSPLITGFTGYQSGDEEEVLKQVFAIWQVLQRRGIKYSDVSTTTPSKTVVSQVVRTLDQTVEATQANCVDGTVLMASILTKIGIHAYLVMVPGHCFLAFDGDAKGDSVIGLETTLLGQDNLKSIDELKQLQVKAADKKVDLKKLNESVAKEAQASMATFLNAIDAGNASLDKHAKDLLEGSDPSIQLISVRETRQLGIMPLPSGKNRQP